MISVGMRVNLIPASELSAMNFSLNENDELTEYRSDTDIFNTFSPFGGICFLGPAIRSGGADL